MFEKEVAPAAAMRSRPRVSPFARRRAAELGVDLTAVSGTGTDGAVRADDVRRAAATAKAPPAEGARASGRDPPAVRAAGNRAEAEQAAERQAAMRRAIGNLMARSKREIPHGKCPS